MKISALGRTLTNFKLEQNAEEPLTIAGTLRDDEEYGD
jgi:hypothetical protein